MSEGEEKFKGAGTLSPYVQMGTDDTMTASDINPSDDMTSSVKTFFLYESTLADVIDDDMVKIRNDDIHDKVVRAVPVQMMPLYRLLIGEITERFDVSRRDGLARIGRFGFSILQHKYHGEYEILHNARSRMLWDAGKYQKAVQIYRSNRRLFENVRGGREQVNVYGSTEDFVAAVLQTSDCMNVSASDLMHVCIGMALLTWDELPEHLKKDVSDDVARFDKHVNEIVGLMNSLS